MNPPRDAKDDAVDQDISRNDFAGVDSELPSEEPVDPDAVTELGSDEYTNASGYHDEEG